MSMPDTRFRVEFLGKSFPEHYPSTLIIPSQTKERAKEWGQRQLECWRLSLQKIRVVVTDVHEEKKEEKKEEKTKKASGTRTRTRTRTSKRPRKTKKE